MLSTTVLLLLAASIPALAAPVTERGSTCTSPRVRKEWGSMADTEKSNYLDAVICLRELPAQGTSYFSGAVTRFDDFSVLHINLTTAPTNGVGLNSDANNFGVDGPGIHFNGVFLPWHRYNLWLYETTLQKDCNYTGAQPYWDWSLHFDNILEAPVFNATLGFGTNGTAPDSCVTDGTFANFTSNSGPAFNLDYNPRCLTRDVDLDLAASALSPERVELLMGEIGFVNFTKSMDIPLYDAETTKPGNGVHNQAHEALGGEFGDVWSTANDPLFYLHHANLDRLWYEWQKLSTANQNDFGGPVWPNGTGTVTLETSVEMAPFVADTIPVSQLMDTVNTDGTGIFVLPV